MKTIIIIIQVTNVTKAFNSPSLAQHLFIITWQILCNECSLWSLQTSLYHVITNHHLSITLSNYPVSALVMLMLALVWAQGRALQLQASYVRTVVHTSHVCSAGLAWASGSEQPTFTRANMGPCHSAKCISDSHLDFRNYFSLVWNVLLKTPEMSLNTGLIKPPCWLTVLCGLGWAGFPSLSLSLSLSLSAGEGLSPGHDVVSRAHSWQSWPPRNK